MPCRLKFLLQAAVSFSSLVFLWQVIIWIFHTPSYFLPSPVSVLQTIWHCRVYLAQQAWPTILESLLGLSIAIVWGVLMALAMSLLRAVRFWMLPIILISQAIPTFAVAPFFVIWFGYGIDSKVAVTIFTLFFPITIALFEGLKRIDPDLLAVVKTLHANKLQLLWHVKLPAAMPALAAGIRMAAAWAPLAAVVGEWVGASRGLGFVMLNASARVDIALSFAALFILVAFALSLYFCIDYCLRRVVFW